MLTSNELKHHEDCYHGFLKLLGFFIPTVAVVVITVFSMIAH